MEIPKDNDEKLQILRIKKVRSIASEKYEIPKRYADRLKT